MIHGPINIRFTYKGVSNKETKMYALETCFLIDAPKQYKLQCKVYSKVLFLE